MTGSGPVRILDGTVWCVNRLAIVSALLWLIHPLLSADEPTDYIASLRDRLPERTESVEAPDRAGHAFYPDLYVSPIGDPSLVVVEDLRDPVLAPADVVALADAGVGILIVAPRRVEEAPGIIAEDAPALGGTVPRVFLAPGAQSEWVVSIPGEVTPQWFTSLIGRVGGIPLNLAQLNAARLGFGLPDADLRLAFDAGFAAARLNVAPGAPAVVVLTRLARAVSESGNRRGATTYLVVPFGNRAVLDERVLIWGVVAALALGLALMLVRPRRTRHYLRAIGHNAAPILAHFLTLTVALIAVNFALRAVLNLGLDSLAPIWLTVGKLSLGVIALGLLYTLPFARVRRLTAVYTASSLFLLIVGALVAGAVSITLGAFFVFALIMGIGFSLGHNIWLKGLFLLLAFAPGLYLVAALAAAADPVMVRTLLTPPIQTEVITAVLLLPLVLMFFRLDALSPELPLHVVVTMVATAVLAVVVATVVAEVREGEPTAVVVRESYEVTVTGTAVGTVAIAVEDGDVRTDPVGVSASGGVVVSCDILPCEQSVAAPDAPVSIEVTMRRVLDRTVIGWRLLFDTRPELIDLSIASDTPVQLYASDVPAQQDFGASAETFRFPLGRLPPREVTGEVVLTTVGEVEMQDIAVEALATWTGPPLVPAPREGGDWRIASHEISWRVAEVVGAAPP